jgi:hypothetical protein
VSPSSLLLSLGLASVVAPALANDPADSWLVYAIAAGGGSQVLSVNATWAVPAFPTTRGGGNAPGWWFGVEPAQPNADVLIQPILAYGDGTPDYTIFTGLYDWHGGEWIQSPVAPVKPGDMVTGSIWWDAAKKTYMQSIARKGNKAITTTVAIKNLHGETFTDVYFVVEHQPNSCSEYPANGGVVFHDIAIAWADGHSPDWAVHQFKPACNSQGKVVNATAVSFSWDTTEQS